MDRVLYEYNRVIEQRQQQLLQRVSHTVAPVPARQEVRIRKLFSHVVLVPEESLYLLRFDIQIVVITIKDWH